VAFTVENALRRPPHMSVSSRADETVDNTSLRGPWHLRLLWISELCPVLFCRIARHERIFAIGRCADSFPVLYRAMNAGSLTL
jgi:hypothetical protein